MRPSVLVILLISFIIVIDKSFEKSEFVLIAVNCSVILLCSILTKGPEALQSRQARLRRGAVIVSCLVAGK